MSCKLEKLLLKAKKKKKKRDNLACKCIFVFSFYFSGIIYLGEEQLSLADIVFEIIIFLFDLLQINF
jgi:hypothetical protein